MFLVDVVILREVQAAREVYHESAVLRVIDVVIVDEEEALLDQDTVHLDDAVAVVYPEDEV